MKLSSDSSHRARRAEELPFKDREARRAFVDPSSAEHLRSETERMASLGTLAAGVAHEINNPLSYVLGSLDVGLRELGDLRELLRGRSGELAHISDAVAALDSAREGAERV